MIISNQFSRFNEISQSKLQSIDHDDVPFLLRVSLLAEPLEGT